MLVLNPETHNRQEPVIVVGYRIKQGNLDARFGVETHHIRFINIWLFVVHDAVNRVEGIAGWVGEPDALLDAFGRNLHIGNMHIAQVCST